MCGIAGVMALGGGEANSKTLDRMMTALQHRGPDGEGAYAARNVALGQTRLAIIDLEMGNQPLYETGGAVLVANGEIYNYRALRTALMDEGVAFTTESDTEVLLRLYERDGAEILRRDGAETSVRDAARDAAEARDSRRRRAESTVRRTRGRASRADGGARTSARRVRAAG